MRHNNVVACLLLCWCRLGARGVQAAAADPGAVRTNIYNNSPKLGKGFIKTMIDNCYAPPEDGAQVCGHIAQDACTQTVRLSPPQQEQSLC